jgi:hypothetical protein
MADSLLQNVVKRIEVETVWLPRVVIDDPFAKAPPPKPGEVSVNSVLKPRVLLYSAYSAEPVEIAPYGKPRQMWPLVKWLGIGIVGLLALNIAAPQIARRLHG